MYRAPFEANIRQSTKSAVFCNISFVWIWTKWENVFLLWTQRSSLSSGSRRKNVVFCRSLNERKLSFVWVWTKGSWLSSESGRKEAVFHLSLDERKLSFVWVLTKGSCLSSESARKEVVLRLSLDERKLSFVWVWTKGTFKKRVNCDKS